MAKNSTIGDGPKAGVSCEKSQARAPVEKPSKNDVKPSRPGKKSNWDTSVLHAVVYHLNRHPENMEHNRILEPFT